MSQTSIKPRKRVIIRSDDKPRGPRVNVKRAFRAQKALGRDIVEAVLYYAKRKGITAAAFAEKCKWRLPRLMEALNRSHKLDLRTIALWESVLGEDLIVSPMFREGYFGRKQARERLQGLQASLPSYLRAAKATRVLGTPFIKAKHLR